MWFDRSVPYFQVEHYLKGNPGTSFADAVRHFTAEGTSAEHLSPFPKNYDIILATDEDFIGFCDHLPVNMVLSDDDSRLTASVLFPYNCECFVTRHLNALKPDFHCHDFFEFCYVWQGGCEQYTAGETFSMSAGDFLIIPPEVIHGIKANSGKTIIFNIIARAEAFRSSSFNLLIQNYPVSAFLRHCLLEENRGNCLLIHTDNDLMLKRIIKHMTQACYANKTIYCDFAIGIFIQLLCYLFTVGEIQSKYLPYRDHVSSFTILCEIQTNYQTVTLKSLSEKYFFSEEYLSRLIRKLTGKTFSTLLRETRIHQAEMLLSRTTLSIVEISELVGYSEAANFAKAFKAVTGLSPAQYRKQQRI